MSKDGIYFHCIHLELCALCDEVFCIYFGKYGTASHLSEHSKSIQFEDRAAKNCSMDKDIVIFSCCTT